MIDPKTIIWNPNLPDPRCTHPNTQALPEWVLGHLDEPTRDDIVYGKRELCPLLLHGTARLIQGRLRGLQAFGGGLRGVGRIIERFFEQQ